jgi:hypothetical protein
MGASFERTPMKTIILVLLLATMPAMADDWTIADKQREAVYLALHAIDWAQTRTIARNPDRWYEVNPILGEHPSVGRVDGYFAVMALAHIAVSNALPTRYRTAWQYVSIGFEAGVAGHNLSLGIGVKF